jgi:TonB-dependent receptor
MTKNCRRILTIALWSASPLSLAVLATPAAAQERSYDIKAQPLAAAVLAYSRQSGVFVLAPMDLVKGKRSTAVRGSYSASEALEKLLSGSGLQAVRGENGGLALVRARAPGNVEAAPARAEAPATLGSVAGRSASASTVVDARTGAALKGALVEIVETGERTSTGDLGEFRFPGKTGSFNLRVSYLGYPQYEQFVDLKDGRATAGIILSDGSAAGEIVVTAYKSARAQALNQERTAENTSTVISDDLTGKFDGTTISDALRRAPGVAFLPSESSGDGENIIVRGLAPDFNTITLNGQRLPANNNANRAPSLNTILADSVSKITINKTLLPSQDGSGTGGLVEIETKGPLDRADRYLSLTAEKGFAGKDFLDDTAYSGTASMRFGESKNFGISVSAQYRKRDINGFSMSTSYQYGEYLPAGISGPFAIDPRTAYPFEPGVRSRYQTAFSLIANETSVENLNLGASMQWQIGGHTDLRLDFQRNTTEEDRFSRSLSFDDLSGYVDLPIDELGGETRSALVWEDYLSFLGNFVGFTTQRYGASQSKDVSNILTFNGSTNLGPWEFGYQASYADGRRRADDSAFALTPGGLAFFDRSHFSPELLANTTDGRLISAFLPSHGSRVLLPSLSATGFEYLSSDALNRFTGGQSSTVGYANSRFTVRVDTTRRFSSGALKYLKAGIFYENSRTDGDPTEGTTIFSDAQLPSQLGLSFENNVLGRIGSTADLRLLRSQDARRFLGDLVAGNVAGAEVFENPANPLEFDDFTTERDFATYLQGSFQFGRLEIVGGLRFERVKTNSFALYAPQIIDADGLPDEAFAAANTELQNFRGSHDTFLPRVMVNYRFSDSAIVRFGYYNAIARPSLNDLSSSWLAFLNLQPFFGPAGDQPVLTLVSGNPNLKSATTNSFDLSFEWYFNNVGVIKAGAFYKPTKNSIMTITSVETEGFPDDAPIPDDPRFETPNLYRLTARPENSPDLTTLWGLEFSVERQLNFLPGLLSGLGVYANYTYTKGSKSESYAFAGVPEGFLIAKVPYTEQPPHSGTFALTYSKGRVNGSLGYTYQAGLYSGFPVNGFSSPNRQHVDTLDLRLGYDGDLGGMKFRIFVEGSNLLKGTSDVTLSRAIRNSANGDTYPTSTEYLGGRTVRAGLTATF